MPVKLRHLELADLKAADTLLQAAFHGSSRLQDLQLYRQIQPEGWFVAEQSENSLVGMVGTVNYGPFAHIGLMAVHPAAQRQGIGLTLMQFLLAWLAQQQTPVTTLDASEMGQPLYEKLGFVPYKETYVFQLQRQVASQTPSSRLSALTPQDLDELVQADLEVFGADRRKVFQALLGAFPGRAFLHRDDRGRLAGYLFAQPNRIGPWAMLQPGNAEALLQAALELPFTETPTVIVPAENLEAPVLLREYGFEQVRANRHMGKGSLTAPGQRQKIYAQASLAIG